MNTISIQYFQTPVGEMILGSYDDTLCIADWRYRKGRESIDRRVQKGLHAVFMEEENEVLNVAKEDMGRVIGKNGRVANSIRTLLRVAAERDGVQATLDVMEP